MSTLENRPKFMPVLKEYFPENIPAQLNNVPSDGETVLQKYNPIFNKFVYIWGYVMFLKNQ